VAKRPVGEVIITLPAAAAGDAVRRLVRYALGAVAGVLVVALIVAFLFAGNLGRKVEHLTAAASAVAAGRYDAPLPVEGGDEIGELARAFDAMQKGLADREARLKEATEQLAQSEKMGALGQLAAGISHEIKNPMAGIIGFAQLGLKRVPADSPIAEDFRIIEREGKRSLEILQNLLRFARREEMALEPIDPNAAVEESLTIAGHQLKLLKIRVEKRLDPRIPKVNGNLGQLQQVLMNFILNGAQAMQPKGGVLTLSSGRAPDGRIVLEVKDEGSGISEENKKKLFTPFFSTKPKSEGTGLGLSVSYGIIRSHGGEIKVWSEQGVGSIFYVYLPALPA
jgi:signal transduction histidine kinase